MVSALGTNHNGANTEAFGCFCSENGVGLGGGSTKVNTDPLLSLRYEIEIMPQHFGPRFVPEKISLENVPLGFRQSETIPKNACRGIRHNRIE